MESSSTSSPHKSYKYDVFLSFSGEDTRRNFTDHLYDALQRQGIHTFKDNERLDKGKTIHDELLKSIEDSKFYIVVFSKNYASSSWCLNELVKIMECHKTNDQTAYPVFYDVDPSEVRKQHGSFGEAFAIHKNELDVGKWREALKDAANLSGWDLRKSADGHEARFIRQIVEEISLELRSINLTVDEKLVGMERRIKDIESSLDGPDEVRMIGIKGMGGGGKTTLARAIFDKICMQFEGKSFVENVREVSKGSLSGLKSLQEQVLSDVLNEKLINLSSVHDGKNMMKKRLCGKKVLVVLDDVDNIDQLEALSGGLNWFKPGSRIIITTRDEQVLIAHRVKLIHDVNLLSDEEAICLFSRHAFGTNIPIQGYVDLSLEVVCYAAGLPLTIRVLGSFLCGKTELEWLDALKRLKTIPLKETLEKLELSYLDLEDDYKEIFLNIACLLKGWKKDKAIRLLESCGFHARNGLRVLEYKSLITMNFKVSWHSRTHEGLETYVDMHDHIEELGKNIVRRLHPGEPSRHSHMWIREEIEDVLANDLGTEATRYIKANLEGLNPEICMKGLGNMKNVRVLDLNSGVYSISGNAFFRRDWELDQASQYFCSDWELDQASDWELDQANRYFSDALRYLKWVSYPFRSLPKTFRANNLVALELKGGRLEQLWEGSEKKVLSKLRFIDLRYLFNLTTLDLGLTPNLEMITLVECCNLVELHMPVGCPNLKSINLNSSKLRSFHLGLTPNLETLCLVGCHDLVELHMSVEYPNLKSVDLSDSKLRTLDLGLTPKLETLKLVGCHDLVEISVPIGCLHVEFLDYNTHSKLRTLDQGMTPNLEKLSLKSSDDLVELNVHVGCLRGLAYLDLSGCSSFKSFVLTKQFGSLEFHLSTESLDICPLGYEQSFSKFWFSCDYEEQPSSSFVNLEKLISVCRFTNHESFLGSICKLRDLRNLTLNKIPPDVLKDLHRLECLEELNLLSIDIKHLPDSICKLKHLRFLRLDFCRLLEKLPEDLGQLECLEKLALLYLNIKHLSDSICMLKHLKSLEIESCWLLDNLPADLGRLECLEQLYLSSTCIKHLPDSICILKQLRSLVLDSCRLLEKLPEVFGGLECLEMLTLLSINIRDLPDSICMLKHLISLKIDSCWLLEKLPEDLGRLECLKHLHLSSTRIKHLPDSICTLKNLISLHLESCTTLEKLPENLGQLECLEKLSLFSMNIKYLPDSICMLKHLKILELVSCWALEKLPVDLGQLECMEFLTLKECISLGHIPNNICKMKSLRYFHLPSCILVEKLPEELGCLERLVELNIEGTGISHLPHSISLLKSLNIIAPEIHTSRTKSFFYI